MVGRAQLDSLGLCDYALLRIGHRRRSDLSEPPNSAIPFRHCIPLPFDGMSDTQWTILGEQVLDENRHIRLSTADIRLPDGVEFTQYVARMPRCAMTLVLNDSREVLLMYRHRWIIDQWVWELPGGYVDHAEDVALAAAREVEEETGWRPRTMQHLVTYQPAIGTLDQPQEVYLARGADLTDTPPDINEAEAIRWVPLDEAVVMIDRGEIIGAATVVGVYRALTLP
ncbi:NUDIX hydrolase [Nocardia fluminea]|uniref:NUDIX hydrolase n=1 Tax=Nocardia fluminea TaxID=134984 RepID=UPI0036519D94